MAFKAWFCVDDVTRPVDREMRQESLDLGFAHIARMALVVKQHEAPDPVHVGVLGPHAVVLSAGDLAYLLEQPGPAAPPRIPLHATLPVGHSSSRARCGAFAAYAVGRQPQCSSTIAHIAG